MSYLYGPFLRHILKNQQVNKCLNLLKLTIEDGLCTHLVEREIIPHRKLLFQLVLVLNSALMANPA